MEKPKGVFDPAFIKLMSSQAGKQERAERLEESRKRTNEKLKNLSPTRKHLMCTFEY
jgi:hypothetical protein